MWGRRDGQVWSTGDSERTEFRQFGGTETAILVKLGAPGRPFLVSLEPPRWPKPGKLGALRGPILGNMGPPRRPSLVN